MYPYVILPLTGDFQLNAQQQYSEYQRGVWELFKKIPNLNYPDLNTYRQIRFLSAVGPAALSPDQLDRVSINHLISDDTQFQRK